MNSKRINFENEHTGLMWLFLFSMFIVTSFYVFETSRFLGSFYDEIVSLMSNYSFITGLDFDASYAKEKDFLAREKEFGALAEETTQELDRVIRQVRMALGED